MRTLSSLLSVVLVTSALVAAPLVGGCKSKRKVKVVWVGGPDANAQPQMHKSEEELRQEYEDKKKARENAPEPKIDPSDPREKFLLVWRMGGDKLNSIYGERAEMIAQLKRMDIHDKQVQKVVDTWIPKLTQFGIGHQPDTMGAAPKELCKLITQVREPAEKLIDEGETHLKKLQDETDKLDAQAETGKKISNYKWKKIEKARKKWSEPALAGKQMLLIVKSMLQEAYVLADLGPRHVQRDLRQCLEPISKHPLKLDLAQQELEKVISRAKWYRELR